MTQPTLDGGVPRAGARLWSRFTDHGRIQHAEWMRACATPGGRVGRCSCGGFLKPCYPQQTGQRTDYHAACDACRHEVVAPGGRTGHKRTAGGH